MPAKQRKFVTINIFFFFRRYLSNPIYEYD